MIFSHSNKNYISLLFSLRYKFLKIRHKLQKKNLKSEINKISNFNIWKTSPAIVKALLSGHLRCIPMRLISRELLCLPKLIGSLIIIIIIIF